MLFRCALPFAASLAACALAAQSGSPSPAPGVPAPQLPEQVVAGLASAKQVVDESGDRIWAGYGDAPFGFLYVAPDHEILLCDVRIPAGFASLAPDQALGCAQARGPASWRKANLLAAMPIFGRPSVIVMGSPESTGRSIDDWTMTIFHEHFHQWQSELPGYFARVDALDLAGGDQTGMWMLNYPFPYDDRKIGAAFSVAARALRAAVEAGQASFAAKRRAYRKARAALAATVAAKDWRYVEFQLWQEGTARWTEIEVARQSGQQPLIAAAAARRKATLAALSSTDLAGQKRLAFYAFGAAEAMLLERSNPAWRACYARTLSIGALYQGCASRG